MERIKVIYNPFSGAGTFKNYLHQIIEISQLNNYKVDFYMLDNTPKNFDNEINDLENCKKLFISGGDGTVNIVLNKLMRAGIDIPLGIIPSGTANDFANFFDLPTDPIECFEKLLNGNEKKVDIGKANDKYFINVCSAGDIITSAHNINTGFKESFGKIAYYLNCIGTIANYKTMKVNIKADNIELNEELYFFTILNTSNAGGFNTLAPHSEIDDGKFTFLGVRVQNYADLMVSLLKIVRGEHTNDKNIIFIKSEFFEITTEENHETDIDGEPGPAFPLIIQNLKQKLTILH